MIVIFHNKDILLFSATSDRKNKSLATLITGSLANAPDFIKYCSYYSAQTLSETDAAESVKVSLTVNSK